jgi:D-beta-D-heptose 7-phosphate kinase/D-beta-D-heptose 1-phosphate adenosyltransferase|tara:strand:- start:155 stop:553 length:399 start_codon:yes stop_codon:yes gene_type:complete
MVIFTNGCFDILHIGHVKLLKYAKSLGSRLIVGINSDCSVKRLKGSSRPINNLNNRKELLESLSCVDEVISFDEDTPYNLINIVKPDIIVKGGDYKPKEVVGSDICKVVIFNLVDNISTTKILNYEKNSIIR